MSSPTENPAAVSLTESPSLSSRSADVQVGKSKKSKDIEDTILCCTKSPRVKKKDVMKIFG